MPSKFEQDIRQVTRESRRSGKEVERGYLVDPDISRMYHRVTDGEDLVSVILGDSAYAQRFRARGWNIHPTILQDPSLAIRHRDELGGSISRSKHAHALRADHFRDLLRRFREERGRLIRWAEATYGTRGPVISGGFHENWPDETKDWIRFLAHGETRLGEAVKLHEYLSKTRSPAFH